MRQNHWRRTLAALLAAMLLAGCGTAPSQMTRKESSIAGPPVKTESALPVSAPEADTAPEPENGTETPQELPPLDQRVTNQWEINKNLRDPAGRVLCLNMEVPRINSTSADAARINARLAQCYVEPCKPCLEYPALENGTPWDEVRSVGYYQYWYGDCLSLVMNVYFSADSSQKGQGFCFDFASGKELTTTQMLERMGLDPADTEQRIARQADEIFEECWEYADTSTCPAKASFDRKWWSSLDQLPLSIWGDEDERNVSLGAEIYNAGEQKYVSYELTIPLYDDSVPSDWQQQLQGSWTVTGIEVDGDRFDPREGGETILFLLEPGRTPQTMQVTRRSTKGGNTTTQVRTGTPEKGKFSGAYKGAFWHLHCPKDADNTWDFALLQDGSLTMADCGEAGEYSYISWYEMQPTK